MSASVSRDAACAAWQLPNGLAVRVLSTPGKPRADALLFVAAGSHNEPQAWPGLAHLLEHVLFGDNQQYRGAERLMPWTEAAGGQVNASTKAASTQFFFEVPAAALTEGVRRLVAMLALPAWSTEATMREVAVIDAEYRARGRDGDTLTEAALAWAVAEGHPLHRFCAGNRDALGACPAALQRALRAYHQRFFHAANMTLWLQGPQSEQALRAIAVACAPALAARPPGPPCRSAALELAPGRPADAPLSRHAAPGAGFCGEGHGRRGIRAAAAV